jgi:hypothetical protein
MGGRRVQANSLATCDSLEVEFLYSEYFPSLGQTGGVGRGLFQEAAA